MIGDVVSGGARRPTPALVGRILRYARPYAGWIALSLALLLAMSAAVNTLPLLIRHAVDRWLMASAAPADERWRGLTRDGALFLAVAGVAFLVRFAESLLTTWIGQRVVHDIRADAFRKSLSLDLSTFDRTPVGRLMTRLTSDVEAVQRFVTEGVVGGVADLFMLTGVIGFMVYLHTRLALWTLAAMPPLFAALVYVSQRLRRANRAIRACTSALNSLAQEQLTGMATIQLFGREARACRQFEDRNAALYAAHLSEVRWFSLYWPVLEIAQAVSIVVVLAAGGAARTAGDATVTIGVLAAFLAYVRDLYRPIGALADKAGLMQQAAASAERVFELLDTPVAIAEPPRPAPAPAPPAGAAAVQFDGVWFAYTPGTWVLEDIAVAIRPGESVAVVGATGAGKSTLAALLCRFYDPQRGCVRLDGRDIRDLPLRELRRRVGVVLQEPFIFSGTIAQNIALAVPNASREEIEAAARFVNADAVVRRCPRGYDTIVGERGGTLSGGERQLIALARVALAAPSVLVALDEATASVDSETEGHIQAALRRLMRGRTTLVIAHRLSTVRDADRILVMRRGRIVAEGTHEALLRTDPYYRHLYELMRLDAGGAPAA